MARQTPRSTAAARHNPDVVEHAQVAIAFSIGREGEHLSVGRPGRLDVVPIAISDRLGLAVILADVQHEQVLAHRLEEAFAVTPVVNASDDLDPRRLALFVRLAFLSGDLLDVDTGRKSQAVAAGRPHRWACTTFEPGELAGFAALQRQYEDLRA